MRLKSISTFVLFACVSVVISFTSCRSSRHAVSDSQAVNVGLVTDDTPKGQVTALLNNYKEWSDVEMSVKCNIRAPKSMSVSGKATFIRGELIKVSFRMLGFEVAALYADRDSIYVYEKLNRTMMVEPLARLTEATGLDLSGVQDILLGRIVFPERIMRDGKIFDDGNNIELSLNNRIYDMLYTIMRGDVPTLRSLSVTAERGDAICLYAPALLTEAGPVCPTAEIKANLGKQSVDASFSWSLESASWNKGLTIDAKPPTGYRRIPFQQLIKTL